jgi:acyl carrier protein
MTFLTELASLYRSATGGAGAALPPVEYQYVDFARWQTAMLASDGERLWAYWKECLAGDLPVLQLPSDRPRPPSQSFEGATHRREVPQRIADGLAALGRAEETTLFTVLLAAFQVLLHRLTGQRDILVGSPIAGRSRVEFEHVLGYFLNALPLRADFSGDPDFRCLLRQARGTVRGALAHQDFPVELLAERLKPARSAGHAALFQAMFVLNRLHRLERRPTSAIGAGQAGELMLERIPVDLNVSQFDLSLEIDDVDDRLATRWEYSTDLFRETTIAGWARQFEELLDMIVENPDRRVSELPSIADSDGGARARRYTAPRTAAEEVVVGAFREVLDHERVSVCDSFFELGGDSFKAVRVISQLNALAGVDLGLAALFEAPTAERLAARLEETLLEQARTP